MNSAIYSPDDCSPNRKAKEAWQKVAKNLNVNTKYFQQIFSNDHKSRVKNNEFWSSCTTLEDKKLSSAQMSEFKFAHGLPIKDSDKDSFSSGVLTKLVVNPEGTALVAWLGLITLGFGYYAWSLIARQAFEQLQSSFSWTIFDYCWDVVFVADLFFHGATGILEDGLLVTNLARVSKRYVKSRWFALDVACLLPFPFASPDVPLLRLPRLLKVFRAKEFIRRVEWAISFPNVLRVANLVHTLMLLMHWFACFYFMVSVSESVRNEGERGWAYPFSANDSEWSSLRRKYLHSLYWSCLTLTTIGEKQSPNTDVEYLCTMAAYFLGIFVFATVVGQVGNVITAQNENKQAYQKMVDHAKKFMTAKNIPKSMQQRVLRWYRYSRSRGALTGDNDVNSLEMVPDSLKTELAIFVNLHTLRKVSIFQLVQPEFLHHLVLKMKSCIYTPNDLICRYGEVGREMFIVNHGFLEVISESGSIVARLKTGDFFGEIGILNLNEGVNKRVASVRSVGYSEVFILSADDLIQAMDYYPDAKQLLLLYGRKRFQETEKRKQSQRFSVISDQNVPAQQARDATSDSNRKLHLKTAEILVSSTVSTVESSFMECIFPHPASDSKDQMRKLSTHEKEEPLKNPKPQHYTSPNRNAKETPDIKKLEKLIRSLSAIVEEHKPNNSSSDQTVGLHDQQNIIDQQQEEIERLNSDIKLLMKKLEETQIRI